MKIVYFLASITILATSCAKPGHTYPSSSILSASQSGESAAVLFRIYRGGKFGYINSRGAIVIEPKYDDAEGFSEGMALVTVDQQRMFIDKAGNIVIRPQSFEGGFNLEVQHGNHNSAQR